ncbi:MAG: hypothetical protein JXL80_17325 [Planctomycetes bacterium]|nr:hypothetical protein [Planctomycetota bacterium]
MSHVPSDLTLRVGQDYATGELFRSALRTCRRNFWSAVGYMLLMGLIVWLPVGAVSMMCSCFGPVLLVPLAAIVYVLAGIHIMSGYGWSVVCTFDDRRMQADDIFYPFRTRYTMLLLMALAEMGVAAVPVVGSGVLGGIILAQSGGALGPGGFATVGFGAAMIVIPLLTAAIVYAVHAFFFLAPLFAFTNRDLTWKQCVRCNWLVLRNRPRQFLTVYLLPGIASLIYSALIAVAIAVSVAAAGGGPGSVAPLIIVAIWGATMIIGPVLWCAGYVLYAFLKAALFRAAAGYTLDLPTAGLVPLQRAVDTAADAMEENAQ